jgi:hypothetical protein
MIIKFRFVSGEVDDFVRDIEIYDDSTFLDLHYAIQEACEYDRGLLATFFMSNDNWDKEQEIILEKMDAEAQKDTLLMSETKLKDLSLSKGQKIIYIFDFFSIRSFFIEVVNIRKKEKEDKNLEYPICTLYKGKPPAQIFVDKIEDLDFDDDLDGFDDDYLDDGFDNIDEYDL